MSIPNQTAYGLSIQANRHVPGLPDLFEQLSAPDLAVTFETDHCPTPPSGPPVWRSPSLEVKLSSNAFHFAYSDGTVFLVDRRGREVQAWTAACATLEDTATYLVGPILGFVLRLRGIVCLHASAILTRDGAVAVCGPAGSGKSTTAAAFARLGFPVMAEDVVALTQGDGVVSVQPGYPRVNLWPQSANSLFGSPDALPLITPTWEKRYFPLDGRGARFHNRVERLAAIYILDSRLPGAQPEIVEQGPAERLMALVANGYNTYLLDAPMRAREFAVFSDVVRRVPVRLVRPTAEITQVNNLCQAILADVHDGRN